METSREAKMLKKGIKASRKAIIRITVISIVIAMILPALLASMQILQKINADNASVGADGSRGAPLIDTWYPGAENFIDDGRYENKDGIGTAANPFIIRTADELAGIEYIMEREYKALFEPFMMPLMLELTEGAILLPEELTDGAIDTSTGGAIETGTGGAIEAGAEGETETSDGGISPPEGIEGENPAVEPGEDEEPGDGEDPGDGDEPSDGEDSGLIDEETGETVDENSGEDGEDNTFVPLIDQPDATIPTYDIEIFDKLSTVNLKEQNSLRPAGDIGTSTSDGDNDGVISKAMTTITDGAKGVVTNALDSIAAIIVDAEEGVVPEYTGEDSSGDGNSGTSGSMEPPSDTDSETSGSDSSGSGSESSGSENGDSSGGSSSGENSETGESDNVSGETGESDSGGTTEGIVNEEDADGKNTSESALDLTETQDWTTLTAGGIMPLALDEFTNYVTNAAFGFDGAYFVVEGTKSDNKQVIDLKVYGTDQIGSNEATFWTPIGTKVEFQGTLDGLFETKNVNIINFHYYDWPDTTSGYSYNRFGLMGTIGANGTVKNMVFEDASLIIKTDKNLFKLDAANRAPGIGFVAGANNGKIENVEVYTERLDKANDFTSEYGMMLPQTYNELRPAAAGGITGINKGSIDNCVFNGYMNVLRTKDKIASAMDSIESGVGGIAGYSKGSISNCIVDINLVASSNRADPTANAEGGANLAAFGGIAGYHGGSLPISNCIVTGKIRGGYQGNYNQMAGGVVGCLKMDAKNIIGVEKSAFGGTVFYRSLFSLGTQYVVSGTITGGSGGLAGCISRGTVDQCFATGESDGHGMTGGLTGTLGDGLISNSYFSGSVYNRQLSSKVMGQNIGGIAAATYSTNCYPELKNIYFLGSMFAAHGGSIVDLNINGSYMTSSMPSGIATNVYYDALISPNDPYGSYPCDDALRSEMGKTTEELINGSVTFTDASKWSIGSGSYPKLKWTENLPSKIRLVHKSFAQSLTAISTYKWLDINDTNSFGHAYEIKGNPVETDDTKLETLLVPMDGATVFAGIAGVTGTGAVTDERLFNTRRVAAYPVHSTVRVLGQDYRHTMTIESFGWDCDIPTIRRVLFAMSQSPQLGRTTTDVYTKEDFFRMLEYCVEAPGGYTGSEFNIMNDIDLEDIPIKKSGWRNAAGGNQFSGTLLGHNYKIKNVRFNSTASVSSTGLFPYSVGAVYDGIYFENVNIDPLLTLDSFGLIGYSFTGSTVKGYINDIRVDGYHANYPYSAQHFGGLIGYITGYTDSSITGFNYSNIHLTDVQMDFLNPSANESHNIGGIVGYNTSVPLILTNSTITHGLSEDCYLKVDYATGTAIKTGYIGGFVGRFNSNNNILTNGHTEMDIIAPPTKTIGATSAICTGGFAGYAGVRNTISSSRAFCDVTGGFAVGGIVGDYRGSDTTTDYLQNSYFIGNLLSPDSGTSRTGHVGGLVGRVFEYRIYAGNCFAMGSFKNENNTGSVGGLVGLYVSTGNYLSLQYCYSNSILEGEEGVAIGGVLGQCNIKDVALTSNRLRIQGCYFIGQTPSVANNGALIGELPNASSSTSDGYFKNNIYDTQLAGELPLAYRIKDAYIIYGSSNKGVTTNNLNLSNLAGGTYYNEKTTTNYPQLKVFAGSADELNQAASDISTRKLFALDDDAESLDMIKSGGFNVAELNSGNKNIELTPSALTAPEDENLIVFEREGDRYVTTGGGIGMSIVNADSTYKPIATAPAIIDIKMPYSVGANPFLFGNGVDAPFIIYDEDIFHKFSKFISLKRDKPAYNYAICTSPGAAGLGWNVYEVADWIQKEADAITLDFTTYDNMATDYTTSSGLRTAMYLEGKVSGLGHDGKRSRIIAPEGTYPGYKIGNTEEYHFGIFSKTGKNAMIRNLEIVNLQVDNTSDNTYSNKSGASVYMGGLIGQASGGTFENIALTTSGTGIVSNRITANKGIGGIVGYSSAPLIMSDITVIADILCKDTRTNYISAGHLVGRVSNEDSATLSGSGSKFTRCATYGSTIDAPITGGLVGSTYYVANSDDSDALMTKFNDCISLVDIKLNKENLTNAKVGISGLLGLNGIAASGGLPNSTASLKGYTFTNCMYGGTMICTRATPNVVEPYGSLTSYMGDQAHVDSRQTNSYFNFDVNHIRNSKDEEIANDSPMFSDTWTMTAGELSGWNPEASGGGDPENPDPEEPVTPVWHFAEGTYPRLVTATNGSYETFTDIDDRIMLESIALYKTGAGWKALNGQFANVYVRFKDASSGFNLTDDFSIAKNTLKENVDVLRMTSNGAMIVSQRNSYNTSNTSSSDYRNSVGVKIEWNSKNPENPQTITKEFYYDGGTDFTGCSDYSWYVMNPSGMWNTQTTDATEGDISLTSWDIYTADQLKGLAELVEKKATDENGVSMGALNFTVPADYKVGSITNRWRLRLGKDITYRHNLHGTDLTSSTYLYGDVTPIGTTTNPFKYKFDGDGYSLMHPTWIVDGETPEGVFGVVDGGFIENLGVTNGRMELATDGAIAGAIAGNLKNGGSISGSYASTGIVNKLDAGESVKTKNAIVGGLVGKVEAGGASRIDDSCFTGYLDIQGQGSVAGGLAGEATNLAIRNTYAAGYILAEIRAGLVGNATTSVTANLTYFDKNVCGTDISGITGFETTSVLTTEQLAMRGLGTPWNDEMTGSHDGYYEYYYPMLTKFNKGSGDAGWKNSPARVAFVAPYVEPTADFATSIKVVQRGLSTTATQNFAEPGTVDWRPVRERGEISGPVTEAPWSTFGLAMTGYGLMKVDSENTEKIGMATRNVMFQLICWYDNPVEDQDGNLTVYTIRTARELAEFAAIVNGTVNVENPNGAHKHNDDGSDLYDTGYNFDFENCTVRLAGNIDLSNIDWVPIGTDAHPFRGTFDGQGYLINNINLTTPNGDGNVGLFGTVDGGTITQVGMQGGSISVTSPSEVAIGALVANLTGENSVIERCYTSVNISGGTGSVGGLVGKVDLESKVESCFSMSTITNNGTNVIGGLAGVNYGEITNSHFTGMIMAPSSVVSGISGEMLGSGTISNSYTAAFLQGGEIYPTSQTSTGTITDCKIDLSLFDFTRLEDDGTAQLYTHEMGVVNGHYKAIDKFAEIKPVPVLNTEDELTLDLNYFEAAHELSTLAIIFQGNRTYQTFTDAEVRTTIGLTSGTTNIQMENAAERVFDFQRAGDTWIINPSSGKTGPGTVNAKVTIGNVAMEKPYYLMASPTLTVRYYIDFSGLITESDTNSNYHAGQASTSDTFASDIAANAETIRISTPDDLMAFSSYASTYNTEGMSFRLDYNINMSGYDFTPIGSSSVPFNGLFDGSFYTITNLRINKNGMAGFFANIGSEAKVRNFRLENGLITASPESGASAITIGAIAAVNQGYISNIAVKNTNVKAVNGGFTGITYMGGLVGNNLNGGVIKGCYFRENKNDAANPGVDNSDSNNPQFIGGMLGLNSGYISGCYVSASMFNNHIKAMFGTVDYAGGGTFDTCFFNVDADTAPNLIKYEYNDQLIREGGIYAAPVISEWFVGKSEMNTQRFATWVSSNLYGQSYYISDKADTSELYGFYLIKYNLKDFPARGNSADQIMITLRNVTPVASEDSFMNAVTSYEKFDFPYFSKSVLTNTLYVDVRGLPDDITLTMDGIAYHGSANYENYDTVVNGENMSGPYPPVPGTGRVSEETYVFDIADLPSSTGELMIIIKLKERDEESYLPWAIYRSDTIK